MYTDTLSKTYILQKILIFLCGVFLVFGFIFFSFIVPVQEINLNSQAGLLIKEFSPFLNQTDTSLEVFLFTLLYIASTFITIILFPGRSITEIWTLLIVFAIPRERKYWGVIFDQKTKEALPFASIYLEKKDPEGNLKPITQAVSDLDGRYRINLQDTSGKVRLTVKAEGYEPFSRSMQIDPLNKHQLLVADIPMKSLNSQGNIVRNFLFKLNFKWNSKLIGLIFLLSVGSLVVTIMELGKVPPLFSVIQFLLYIPAVIWNTQVIARRLSPRIGKILNQETGEGIDGAIVKVFNKKKQQIESLVTNEYGVISFNLNEGDYLVSISKPGYKLSNELNSDKIEVHINSQGYLTENINLVSKDSSTSKVNSSVLINPFQ